MLEQIKLRIGPHATTDPISIGVKDLVVFVGPNNSGKSLVLRELNSALVHESRHPPQKIVEDVVARPLSADDARRLLESRTHRRRTEGEWEILELAHLDPVSEAQHTGTVREADAMRALIEPLGAHRQHWQLIAAQVTLHLTGAVRLRLLEDRTAAGLDNRPASILDRMLRSPSARASVRDVLHGAIGKHFLLDPTAMQSLRVRLADEYIPDGDHGLIAANADRLRNAPHLSEFSDGIRAFAGIVAGLIASDAKITLIDEPEAFLAPPLARRLGAHLASSAASSDSVVVIATHSPDLLFGAIESGSQVTIVRLQFDARGARANQLSSDDIAALMRDPFVRSTGVMTSLFHRGAVLCESDGDRVFYSAVAERQRRTDARFMRDVQFLNLNGKDTIGRVLGPLRTFGVQACAIFDLDIVKVKTLRDVGRALSWPEDKRREAGELASAALKSFEAEGIEPRKGVSSLSSAEGKQTVQRFIDAMAREGLFVVDRGELESWIPGGTIPGHGVEWVRAALAHLEGLGASAASATYPGLPEFLQRVDGWIGP